MGSAAMYNKPRNDTGMSFVGHPGRCQYLVLHFGQLVVRFFFQFSSFVIKDISRLYALFVLLLGSMSVHFPCDCISSLGYVFLDLLWQVLGKSRRSAA